MPLNAKKYPHALSTFTSIYIYICILNLGKCKTASTKCSHQSYWIPTCFEHKGYIDEFYYNKKLI